MLLARSLACCTKAKLLNSSWLLLNPALQVETFVNEQLEIENGNLIKGKERERRLFLRATQERQR